MTRINGLWLRMAASGARFGLVPEALVWCRRRSTVAAESDRHGPPGMAPLFRPRQTETLLVESGARSEEELGPGGYPRPGGGCWIGRFQRTTADS
jgi:hypothetical protein